MRQVADHLDQIAHGLPERDRKGRLLITQNADRLRIVADALTAEVNAGDPWTVRQVAKVAGVGLLSVAVILAPGAAEGAAAALTERALADRDRAVACVDAVGVEAGALADGLARHASEQVQSAAALVDSISRHPSLLAVEEARRVVDGYALRAPDLGLPNLRQRVVALNQVIAELVQVFEASGDRGALDEVQRVAGGLDEVRELIEVLAAHEPSLYPPQPFRPPQDI